MEYTNFAFIIVYIIVIATIFYLSKNENLRRKINFRLRSLPNTTEIGRVENFKTIYGAKFTMIMHKSLKPDNVETILEIQEFSVGGTSKSSYLRITPEQAAQLRGLLN